MSEPTPQPEPVRVHEGFIAKAEEWLDEHVRPELADCRIKAENALVWAQKHAEQAEALGGILVRLVKAVEPADGTEAAAVLADVEKWAADAAKIAALVISDTP
jgi:hypothetical protein